MSTITDSGLPTLQTVAASIDPKGNPAKIAEVLHQKNPILDDIPWMPGNLTTGHRVALEMGIPSPTFRQYNQGIASTKSDAQTFDESCAMLEDYSDVDTALANIGGNPAAVRMGQDKRKLEGFAQTVSTALFYANAATKFYGLAPRYGASTGYTASSYVLPKGTLSGVNCESIWLIHWAEDKVHGIYPSGSAAGLSQRDLGERTLTKSDGTQMQVFTTHFKWDCGLCVADYRYACRSQWDPDDSTNFPDTGKGLVLLLQQMIDTVFDVNPDTARFYFSRKTATKFDQQIISNDVNLGQWMQLGNRRVRSFQGIPIRVTDALVGESAIS